VDGGRRAGVHGGARPDRSLDRAFRRQRPDSGVDRHPRRLGARVDLRPASGRVGLPGSGARPAGRG
jgi:hypothetical protein